MRPGAYINFESVPVPASNAGERGIVTMAVPMTWGPADTLIPLYSTDLLNGKSLEKIGLTAYDEESLIYREALSSAYLALVYRLDNGGVQAKADLTGVTATAKYPGTAGNSIMVSVVKVGETDSYEVITYYKGNEKDRQTVSNGAELQENDWVGFTVKLGEGGEPGQLEETAGTPLTGGANGTDASANYTGYFAKAATAQWNVMAVPSSEATVKTQALNFIKNLRENTGRKRQAVLVDYTTADYEGVISVSQGYENTAGEKITSTIFTATVAGMTAGAAVNQSNTFQVITGAVDIINPIADEEVEAALKKGQFVLTRRQDGEIVVEQDINTLHNFTPSKDYSFSKNRVVRVLDDIGNQVMIKFESAYIGKVDNNDNGRGVFKADVISYMNELQGMGAIQNFDPAADISVTQGMGVDAVACELWVQPVDAMEKLYMLVNVGG